MPLVSGEDQPTRVPKCATVVKIASHIRGAQIDGKPGADWGTASRLPRECASFAFGSFDRPRDSHT